MQYKNLSVNCLQKVSVNFVQVYQQIVLSVNCLEMMLSREMGPQLKLSTERVYAISM